MIKLHPIPNVVYHCSFDDTRLDVTDWHILGVREPGLYAISRMWPRVLCGFLAVQTLYTPLLLDTHMSLKYVLQMAGFSEVRFVPERWPIKWTPRHLAYRFVRWMWFKILKLIYFVELPGQRHPTTFQVRIVAVAKP